MNAFVASLLLLLAAGSVAAQSEFIGVPMAVEEHFRLAAENTQVGFDPGGYKFAVYTGLDGKQKAWSVRPDGRRSIHTIEPGNSRGL